MKKQKLKNARRQSRRGATERKAKARALAIAHFKNSWWFKRDLKEKERFFRTRFTRPQVTKLAEVAIDGGSSAMDRLISAWKEKETRAKSCIIFDNTPRYSFFYSLDPILNTPLLKFMETRTPRTAPRSL